jgi:hypothetical protein
MRAVTVVLAEPAVQALIELPGRIACKRQGYDGSGGKATGLLVRHQERDPLGEQARLAAAGAGDHDKGAIWVGMGRCELVLVELHRISFGNLKTARRAGWPAILLGKRYAVLWSVVSSGCACAADWSAGAMTVAGGVGDTGGATR